ncbi:MAG: Rrf2 family transcriptional regulator [Chlorobi bacterium]|nr:Rrf2 family transcriptional regulator [Chlorobiota bacterium]
MRLSKTSEYAIRILSFMAKNENELFTAKYLIEKLKISDKYLRRLMTNLSKAGLIKSVQGKNGGYTFARKADEIFISNIIDAVEGYEKYLGCILGFDKCSDENPCAMHKVWAKTRNELLKTFNETSLTQLGNNDLIKN